MEKGKLTQICENCEVEVNGSVRLCSNCNHLLGTQVIE